MKALAVATLGPNSEARGDKRRHHITRGKATNHSEEGGRWLGSELRTEKRKASINKDGKGEREEGDVAVSAGTCAARDLHVRDDTGGQEGARGLEQHPSWRAWRDSTCVFCVPAGAKQGCGGLVRTSDRWLPLLRRARLDVSWTDAGTSSADQVSTPTALGWKW